MIQWLSQFFRRQGPRAPFVVSIIRTWRGQWATDELRPQKEENDNHA